MVRPPVFWHVRGAYGGRGLPPSLISSCLWRHYVLEACYRGNNVHHVPNPGWKAGGPCRHLCHPAFNASKQPPCEQTGCTPSGRTTYIRYAPTLAFNLQAGANGDGGEGETRCESQIVRASNWAKLKLHVRLLDTLGLSNLKPNWLPLHSIVVQ